MRPTLTRYGCQSKWGLTKDCVEVAADDGELAPEICHALHEKVVATIVISGDPLPVSQSSSAFVFLLISHSIP